MASRIPQLSGNQPSGAHQAFVTPAMVDRAAAAVLADEPESTKEMVMAIWGRDGETPVTQLLHSAAAATGVRGGYRNVGRTSVVVRASLSEAETRILVDAFPDFDMEFRPTISHDHGLAYQTRIFDEIKDAAGVPPGMQYADFGANVMTHVNQGHLLCLSVVAEVDGKDSQRRVLEELQLARVAQDGGELPKRMARSILTGEDTYLVRQTVQQFSRKMRVGKATHVYDVPLQDWVDMMERCDMELFTGSVHFSNEFFEYDEGLLETVGARFVIDRDNDRFKMGFVGSATRWYPHKWSEFMRYGANQVLSSKTRRYSYHIVERRGQTIRFRILRVAGSAMPDRHQYYAVPGVEAVVVEGFRYENSGTTTSGKGNRIVPHTYTFPKSTWDRCVRDAEHRLMRGDGDVHKLVSDYQLIVASHKYNGVAINAVAVPADQVPYLVVMSAVYAASNLHLTRKTMHAYASEIGRRRDNVGVGTVALAVRTLVQGCSKLMTSTFGWFADALSSFENSSGEALFGGLTQISSAVRYKQVPADVFEMRAPSKASTKSEFKEYSIRDHMLAKADLMEFLDQQDVEKAKNANATDANVEILEGGTLVGTESVGKPATDSGKKPWWLPLTTHFKGVHVPGAEEYEWDTEAHTVVDKRAAVTEAADICKYERDNTEAALSAWYHECVAGGTPSIQRLKENRERWKEADVWRVEKGIIKESILGTALDKFVWSGVYCPVPVRYELADGTVSEHSCLRGVEEMVSEWTDSKGTHTRTYAAVEGDEYTGYVMTNSTTLVLNSRPIERALRMLARGDFLWESGAYVGGPGAGKTHKIKEMISVLTDSGSTPLKESALDMRRELVDSKKCDPRTATRRYPTVDSILHAVGRLGLDEFRRRHGPVSTHFSDEAYNGLPGRVYAACEAVKPKRVIFFGDELQIQPVVRATYEATYKTVRPGHVVRVWIVWRGCPEVLATFNQHYGWRLRTMNHVPGKVGRLTSVAGMGFPQGVGVLNLCMNQASKPEVKKAVGTMITKGPVISTHESQGKSSDVVILHHLDPRKRGSADNLHMKPRYVNVAHSRARQELYLHKPAGVEADLTERWIELAKNPVLVAGGADIRSAGKPIVGSEGYM